MSEFASFGQCSVVTKADVHPDQESIYDYISLSSLSRHRKKTTRVKSTPGKFMPKGAYTRVETGDLLIARVYPHQSYVALVSEGQDQALASTFFYVLRPDQSLVEPKYLYYQTRSRAFCTYISSRLVGSAQPTLHAGTIASAPIHLPPLSQQQTLILLLDELETLRQLKTEADREFNTYPFALYVNLFGKPLKDNGWHTRSLKELATLEPAKSPEKDADGVFEMLQGSGFPGHRGPIRVRVDASIIEPYYLIVYLHLVLKHSHTVRIGADLPVPIPPQELQITLRKEMDTFLKLGAKMKSGLNIESLFQAVLGRFNRGGSLKS